LINIPEDITLGNVEETLTCQNPEQEETLKPNLATTGPNDRPLIL
jgi:hypothetical protein